VQPGEPTLQCMLRIEQLAQRRRHADTAEAVRWSSAAHRLGRTRDPLLGNPAEYWSLGNTPFDREAAYARRLEHGLDEATVWRIDEAAQRGLVFGEADFVARLAAETGRSLRPRPRGRPARQKGSVR
jgi:putative transposase